MQYKLLLPSEFSRLAEFNEAHNLPEPVPGSSLVATIEDGANNGAIVARWDLHFQTFLDNGFILPSYRGKFLNLRKMYRLLEEKMPPNSAIYSTPSSRNGARILEIMGFKEYPYSLYRKVKQ